MVQKDKKHEWLGDFLKATPEADQWPSLVAGAKKKLGRLDPEDQVSVIDHLRAFSDNDAVQDVIEPLSGAKGVGLTALVEIMKLKLAVSMPVDEDHIKELEGWIELCKKDDSGECNPEAYFKLPDKAQKAVVDHLVQWLRGDLIARLEQKAPDKTKLKEIRKALHRVRSQGVAFPEKGGGGGFIIGEREEHIDEAYLSPPDPTGTAFIYIYRTIMGKNTLFVIIVNDRQGVIKFEGFALPVQRFRKILESTRNNPHAIIVKVGPGHVRQMIRKAEEAGRKLGKVQHEQYLSNRRMLGIVDEPETDHPIWSSLDREELIKERGLAIQSHELLDHRMFEDWRMSPLDEGKFMVELKDMELSLIELTPIQERERENQLFEKEAKKVIENEGRQLWRDRMIGCAYLLELIGEPETARTAAATGLALDNEDQPIPSFFVELLRRAVKKELEDDGEEEKGPDMDRGGIVLA